MSKKHKEKVIIEVLLSILAVALIIVVFGLYSRYSSNLADVLSDSGDFYDSVSVLALRLCYNIVAVFCFMVICMFIVLMLARNDNRELANERDAARKKYEITLEQSRDAIWEYDVTTGTLTKSSTNRGLLLGERVVPNSRDYAIKNGIIHPDDREKFLNFNYSLLTSEPNVSETVRAKNSDGKYSWYELVGTKIISSSGRVVSVIGRTTDITKRKEREQNEEDVAGRDKRTGLLNSKTFKQKVTSYLNVVDTATISAMYYMDIDDFARINENHGKVFADAVVIDLASKLRKIFGAKDIVARLDKDSFAVFQNNIKSVSQLEETARTITETFRNTYSETQHPIHTTVSIGIAIYPSDGNYFQTLFEKSAIALFMAKTSGKNQYVFYTDEMAGHGSAAAKYTNISFDGKTADNSESYSLVDSNMIKDAIDILFDTYDLDVSIKMLLSIIGTNYNLDHLFICEYSENRQTVTVTNEWTSMPKYLFKNNEKKISYEDAKALAFFSGDENGVYISDGNIPEIPEKLRNSNGEKLQAMFQCGIMYINGYVGYLCAEIYSEHHVWKQSETDSLILMTKIIGNNLIRLHTLEKADMISHQDALTGAFNFNTFLGEVNKRNSDNSQEKLAIIYTDVNQFKLINETYGYSAGDSILKSIGSMLRQICGNDVLICRVTGDKFICCLPYTTEDSLNDIARDIVNGGRMITSSDGENYKIVMVLGIYLMHKDDNAIVAVDRANIARKNAQQNRLTQYSFYSEKMHSELVEQKEIEDVMEEALLNEEFEVYYQPKFDINTKTICGSEALVRWNRPRHGLVFPNSFIPLFEKNGFIVELDYYVYEQVCRLMQKLMKEGRHVFPVSVNFSREHFKTDELPDRLKAVVEYYNIPPSNIEVEITESALSGVDKHFMSLLDKIRSYGFLLSMDDFGSGLSSFNMLSDLEFNVLKIDKDFFHSKTTTKRERIVISSIVIMASELGMDVICEGVETEDQAEFLKNIGCYMAQGYLFSKPIPEKEFLSRYYSDGAENEK